MTTPTHQQQGTTLTKTYLTTVALTRNTEAHVKTGNSNVTIPTGTRGSYTTQSSIPPTSRRRHPNNISQGSMALNQIAPIQPYAPTYQEQSNSHENSDTTVAPLQQERIPKSYEETEH